jgi:hypothetical protein
MGPIGCPETSVGYQSTVRKIPEEQKSYSMFIKAKIKGVWTAILVSTINFFCVFRLAHLV